VCGGGTCCCSEVSGLGTSERTAWGEAVGVVGPGMVERGETLVRNKGHREESQEREEAVRKLMCSIGVALNFLEPAVHFTDRNGAPLWCSSVPR
jgi:hypothetical protein